MADKLIIEIDGNATGLTKALSNAESRLNTFNGKVAGSNKALGTFENKLGTSANALTRLSGSAKTLDTNLKALTRGFASLAGGLDRLAKASTSATSALNSVSKQANTASNTLNRLGSSTKNVSDLMTSMGRRMTALNNTISAMNAGLRANVRNMQSHGAAVGNVTNIVNNYSRAANSSSGAANNAVRGMNRMNTASLGLAENFRRSVAQITALRTITYQGLFWFAPLIYSIVKVNSAYETQMQLLKNVARATTAAGKAQEAGQTRNWLLEQANNAPFALGAITNAFVKMRVGGVEPMQGSLNILMDSISAFGGGTAELDRAAVAIQQMGGKGVVSMEELRQQLGEHIPDAANAMAVGLGMTMGELFKTIESGTLKSTTALNAMFEVLQARHEGSSRDMMNTWAGMVARLQTSWQKFIVGVTQSAGPASFMETLKRKVTELVNFMNTADGTKLMRDIQTAMAIVIEAFSKAVIFLYTYKEEIIKVAALFATLWGGNLVIGVITRIITGYALLNGKLLGLFTTVRTGTGVIGTMRAAMTVLGLAINNTAGKTQGFNQITGQTASALRTMGVNANVTVGSLARLAGQALISHGAMALLAGGIWLAVEAMSALNRQKQIKAELDRGEQDAKTGGTFKDANDRNAKAQNYFERKRELTDPYKVVTDSEGRGIRVKKTADEYKRDQAEYKNMARGFTALEQNWQRNLRGQRGAQLDSEYNDAYNQRRGNALGTYDTKLAELKGRKGMTEKDRVAEEGKIVSERNAAAAAFESKEFSDLNAKIANAKTPDEKQFYTDKRSQLAEQYQGTQARGDALGNPEYATADGKPGGGKKKSGGGSKTDPLMGARNSVANELVQTAELEHDLENLRSGKDSRFDRDAAQEVADVAVAAKSSKQALKDLKIAQIEIQEELKKTIAVEKAIIDLRDENSETTSKLTLMSERLALGYNTITSQVKDYEAQLRREYRSELQVVEARIASGKATDDQVQQYKKLNLAIADALRLRKVELALETANDAKKSSKDFKRRFRSEAQNRSDDANEELGVITDAISALETDPEEFRKARQKVQDDIAEAQAKLDDTKSELTETQKQDIANNITSMASLEERYNAVNGAMANGLPILRERANQIRMEEEARKRWGGAGGPILDWATSAKKGIDDLGGSMGSLLTDGFDSLVDSLAEGKLAFGDFVKSMLAGLLKIILRALIAKALLSALGMGGAGGGGGGFDPSMGTGPVSVTHTGGIAGVEAPAARNVNTAMFNFAKRYHTGGIIGLGSNEVPIIAEKGEGVFTQEQMAAMGKGNGESSPNVQVNVINQTGTNAQVEREKQKFDGEKWVETIILKKITSPGPVRDSIGAMKR